jgi:two-component system, sensor histidine kinase
MVLVDSSGQIVFSNRQLSALFGYTREELRGQHVETLMPERYRARHGGHRERFAAENRIRPMGAGLDLYACRKDGSEFPVEISLSPLRDQGHELVAAAIRDVSERKRVQEELIQAREVADRANRAKSRFLATASHDLRQPLQSLSLLSGALRRLVDHPDAREVLEHQEQAIESMSRLLNALLDISKLESGAVQPQPVDFSVTTLFAELQHEFLGVARDKGLDFQASAAAECIHSDPSLVGQILRNLVSNAIKYTRTGSVRLRSTPGPERVRIEVLDTGIGIASDQLQLIYDEFYQVGVSANSSRDGYGLGLSIVQRLVKLLDLGLEVRSEPGRGSVFSLDLPAGKPGSGTTCERPAIEQPVRQTAAPTVLLVEDDPAVRDATRMLLKVSGYRVLTASSLGEARTRANEQPLDLLVTDYHLSNGETGTQVIATLRALLGRPLRAVLITGDTSSAMRDVQQDESLRLARKPIHAEELLALLKSLL